MPRKSYSYKDSRLSDSWQLCTTQSSLRPLQGLSSRPSSSVSQQAMEALEKKGCERVAINELLWSVTWNELRCWKWKKKSQINLLESAVIVNWVLGTAKRGGDACLAGIVDSRVALGSTAKGRSPSRSLRPNLSRICSLSLAFGIYTSLSFGPSRFNVADDPTRHRRVREAKSRAASWLSGF